ncbi:glycine oxidase ThiO [Fodinicurvata sp. EGI_FJ10296]|uniref:glycine oxidase ThiO n=1 Tax=Fodinicurvata sp. EGI_FJ10296 TaxID=3231908 RepID=UPI0034564478
MSRPDAEVVGAGVAGLTAALTLAERGARVTVYDRSTTLGAEAASWLAGGMLAPWCEMESADASIVAPGLAAIDWWAERVPELRRTGTLVVAPARDAADLKRFLRMTRTGVELDAEGVAALEPELADRFRRGIHYAGEAWLDPRRALAALADRVVNLGGEIRLGTAADPSDLAADTIVDCRGIAAADGTTPAGRGLRSVRGEMFLLHAPEVTLHRAVRLLHPRIPLYIVPRGDHVFMIGATMIESDSSRPMTLRSAVDLLNAAYAVHPGFAEASILEQGAGRRPAYADNLPRVERHGRLVSINGFYRHGFLLAPSLAEKAADMIMDTADTTHSIGPST